MKRFNYRNLLLAALLSAFSLTTLRAAGPVGLKCEYLVNPIGLDAAQPRFTWKVNDDRPGALQTAYKLSVYNDAAGKSLRWESGKVNAAAVLAGYEGESLQPFTKYWWKVEIWDQDGKASVSPLATFETGMMGNRWQGQWISDNDDRDLKPAAYFRKAFHAKKKIRSARAYIAVAGLYELYINGQKTGNHRLDPMYTRFDRRNLYVTYDVTPQLKAGNNAIGVLLGNGWYNHQSTAVWNFHNAPWRARPAFCFDLRITYTDGSEEVIKSGNDWKTALSPLVFNSIYTAEHYDARLEQPGWATVKFNDAQWKPVIARQAPSNNIVAQAMHPVENVETIPAASIRQFNDTTWLYDLGRTISGVSKIKVSGPAGTVIRLKHSEDLDKNGRADLANIIVHYRPKDDTDPFQTDIFILGGKGEETFMPRFNYKGFQYVEVTSSRPVKLTKESLTGYFMHSAVPVAGKVRSSSDMINKIWWATNNSYLSNLFGYPTDCPQREKNGWTGDAHIASETGLFSFDGITVYEKWLADHRDEQQPNGVLPSIIPTGGWGYDWGNGPDWTSTIAIIPWNIYLFYGDKKLLTDCYDNIKKYVDHITEISPNVLTTWGLGDWVPVKSKTPVEFTSSCFYYKDVMILTRAAQLLGKTADAEKYSALAAKIKTAFNQKYLDRSTAIYAQGVQTELSSALYWGLVPEDMKARVAANLAKRVAQDNFHLDVGLLGTKSILNALSENGYADVAYKVAAQEDFPSWGYWIKSGATTLYENWDPHAKSDLSRNHIMFGEIGAWLYKGVGGILPNEAAPGFSDVLLEPHFVAGLDHFDAEHEGPYGLIQSSWKRTGDGVTYTAVIPANSTGTIRLEVPAGKKLYKNGAEVALAKEYKVTSGKHLFEIK